MPKPDPKPRKQKIDITKKPQKTRELHAKVARLIRDMEEDGAQVYITAQTPRRIANGSPPMQIINSDLDAALNDIATLAKLSPNVNDKTIPVTRYQFEKAKRERAEEVANAESVLAIHRMIAKIVDGEEIEED